MFGYVVINKPDMRIRDFEEYRSYYCGLCRTLKSRYGVKGEVTINYDLTFLAVLLTGLYESDTRKSLSTCIVHPFEKHATSVNEFTEYAADMNILLTYYKCLDDWTDDRKLKAKVFSDSIAGSAKKVAAAYPEKAEVVVTELKKLAGYEDERSEDIDAISGCFGRIMASLFVYRHDEWEPYLSKMGFYLGKYVYILDAYRDYDEDMKRCGYNPLGERAKDRDYVRGLLTMMMSECSSAFEMLPIVENYEIIQNVIYSGVWSSFTDPDGPADKKG